MSKTGDAIREQPAKNTIEEFIGAKMNCRIMIASLLLTLAGGHASLADFVGPSIAQHALSPDGQLLARIEIPEVSDDSKNLPKCTVVFYSFDPSKDAYMREASFKFEWHLPQMLYVSNSGDLVMISLLHDDPQAIRLYSKAGVLTKSWGLQAVLSQKELNACSKTGSTIQWLEEAEFSGRVFRFRGPSRIIRALEAPFTLMQPADETVAFAGSISVPDAALKKHPAERR